MNAVEKIERTAMRPNVPSFRVGDTVDVYVKIMEGEKERTQVFGGTVIRRKGSRIGETFTVRRIIQGEGVERIFPLISPWIVKVEVKKSIVSFQKARFQRVFLFLCYI